MPHFLTRIFFVIFLSFTLINCGGGSGGGSEASEDVSDSINTTKLVGTPFEGLETGDDFDWDFFLCDDYQTQTIDGFPIQIFTAFFTESEEEIVQAGIDIANEAMGTTEDGGLFYELTDTWTDDVRIIYKVDNIAREDGFDPDADGQTLAVDYYFNDHRYAEEQVGDWAIEIQPPAGIDKWVIAHELGHASSLGHWLTDYENDTFDSDALDEDSLMQAILPSDPDLSQYEFMMQNQGEIMEAHLTELGDFVTDSCD